MEEIGEMDNIKEKRNIGWKKCAKIKWEKEQELINWEVEQRYKVGSKTKRRREVEKRGKKEGKRRRGAIRSCIFLLTLPEYTY